MTQKQCIIISMITTSKETKIIELYCAICRYYDSILVAKAQRMSNNDSPAFTDTECLTIYLFGLSEQKFTVKSCYEFVKDYFPGWFAQLPSYQAFNHRICYLSEVFQELCCLLISEESIGIGHTFLIDSLPIIVAHEKRSGKAKVGKDLCAKSYCASQGIWYYGVKLHILGQKVYQTLPKMMMMQVTSANESGITAAKEMLQFVSNISLFADKAYANHVWHAALKKKNIDVCTPVKLKEGQKYLRSADHLFSELASKARQTIESFFNWLNEKTNIQSASKVRSTQGLIAFIFARIGTAVLYP